MVVRTMIMKVQNFCCATADHLPDLMDFARAVRNLVTTMTTVQTLGHLTNPQLRIDLLHQLPVAMQLQWANMLHNLAQK